MPSPSYLPRRTVLLPGQHTRTGGSALDEESLLPVERTWPQSFVGEGPLPRFLAEIDDVLALAAPGVDRVLLLVNGPAVAETMAGLGYDAIDGEKMCEWAGQWGSMQGVRWFEGSCTDTAALVHHSERAPLAVCFPTHSGASRGSDYRGLDVAIAVSALREAQSYDTVMLIPGDGDMEPLVSALLEMEKRVMIVMGSQSLAAEVVAKLRVEDVLSIQDMLEACGMRWSTSPL